MWWGVTDSGPDGSGRVGTAESPHLAGKNREGRLSRQGRLFVETVPGESDKTQRTGYVRSGREWFPSSLSRSLVKRPRGEVGGGPGSLGRGEGWSVASPDLEDWRGDLPSLCFLAEKYVVWFVCVFPILQNFLSNIPLAMEVVCLSVSPVLARIIPKQSYSSGHTQRDTLTHVHMYRYMSILYRGMS